MRAEAEVEAEAKAEVRAEAQAENFTASPRTTLLGTSKDVLDVTKSMLKGTMQTHCPKKW